MIASHHIRKATAAAGAFVAASAIPLLISATAHADAISDVIAAAQVPLTDAQTEIGAALKDPLSKFALSILTPEHALVGEQSTLVGTIGANQETLARASVERLVELDQSLVTADTNVYDATSNFISTIDGGGAGYLDGLHLAGADVAMLGADFHVIIGSILADLAGGAAM